MKEVRRDLAAASGQQQSRYQPYQPCVSIVLLVTTLDRTSASPPQEVRRELAEEVAASRQQWLDEARRARALEAELQSLRQLLQGAAPRY